jgi:hypothetical protein
MRVHSSVAVGMLIIDVSEVKLPVEAKQNNLPPECGQPIDSFGQVGSQMTLSYWKMWLNLVIIMKSLTSWVQKSGQLPWMEVKYFHTPII